MGNMKEKFANFVRKTKDKFYRKGDKWLLAGGIVAGAGAIGTTVWGTVKAVKYLAKRKDEKADALKDIPEDKKKTAERKYKVVSAAKVGLMYLPTAGLAATSVCCLIGSNKVAAMREGALVAAYAALEKTYNSYKDRVREQYGNEADEAIRYGTDVDVKDPETGDYVSTEHINGVEGELYSRCYGPGSVLYDSNREYSKSILKLREDDATRILEADGYLMLNTVYELLGFPKTAAGYHVGWIYEKGKRVSFGLDNVIDNQMQDYLAGKTDTVWLTFNVDGVIEEEAINRGLIARH